MEEHTHSSMGAFGYDDGENCEICKQLEDIEYNQTKYIFQLLEEIKELKVDIIRLNELLNTFWR